MRASDRYGVVHELLTDAGNNTNHYEVWCGERWVYITITTTQDAPTCIECIALTARADEMFPKNGRPR